LTLFFFALLGAFLFNNSDENTNEGELEGENFSRNLDRQSLSVFISKLTILNNSLKASVFYDCAAMQFPICCITLMNVPFVLKKRSSEVIQNVTGSLNQ